MRKSSILLSMIVTIALLLTACGGEETTSVPSTNVPPITVEATSTLEGGMNETPAADTTTTPGVPVTGEDNPSRLTSLMDFNVSNQDGEQIGEVEDFVLDLDNTRISYVVIETGGFLDLGDKTVLIPWNQLQLQTGDTTGGQQNTFVLLAEPEFLQNAPDMDINSTLPGIGQPANNWDDDIRNFWETGQIPGGAGPNGTETAGTPGTTGNATALPQMTATPDMGGTTGTSSGPSGSGTDQGSGDKLQGVMLASEVLGSTITIGQGQAQGQGQGLATAATTVEPAATSSTGSGTDTQATNTPSAGTGTGMDAGLASDQATIEDMIIALDTGDIRYLVLNTAFDDGERWIPVPLSTLRWDASMNGFLFVANSNALQNAPFFLEDEFPDTSADGWDSDFSTFWQNNGGTGGTGTMPTTTP